jgi:hypothetical protein
MLSLVVLSLTMPSSGPSSGSGDPKRIPFHFESNEIRIDATVAGAGPFHLILDTGMPVPGVLLFRNPRVDALALGDSGAVVRVAGVGGDGAGSPAKMANDVAVAFGDLVVPKTSALVVDEPAGFPPGMDGIVGGELFFHFVVRLDMDENRLELWPSDAWTPTPGACVLPIERVRGKIFTEIRVTVGAEKPIPAQVVVDIGAGHALSLNTHEDGRFAPPAAAIESSLGRGASGLLLGKSGRLRRVEIGTFAFENVVASFPIEKHQKGGGGEDFRDGNLGEELLRRFNVTFDYAGKRMVLEKAKSFGEPFEHDMSGLAFDWGKDGSLLVLEVLPGSPAATAGIHAGDRVMSIDGREMTGVSDHGLHKTLTVDGAEVRMSLKRGEETLEKRIRLRRLL